MASFWGCRWEEMLKSISVLTFALPSSTSLSCCCCPVSGWWGLCPCLCRVSSVGTSSFHMCSSSCISGALCCTCLACKDIVGPRDLPSPFKFLLLGMKGGVVSLPSPWWWAASGSSFFSSSFSVVGNKMSPGLSENTVLGVRIPLPWLSAVL